MSFLCLSCHVPKRFVFSNNISNRLVFIVLIVVIDLSYGLMGCLNCLNGRLHKIETLSSDSN